MTTYTCVKRNGCCLARAQATDCLEPRGTSSLASHKPRVRQGLLRRSQPGTQPGTPAAGYLVPGYLDLEHICVVYLSIRIYCRAFLWCLSGSRTFLVCLLNFIIHCIIRRLGAGTQQLVAVCVSVCVCLCLLVCVPCVCLFV